MTDKPPKIIPATVHNIDQARKKRKNAKLAERRKAAAWQRKAEQKQRDKDA